MAKKLPEYAELHTLLRYDPATGLLYWRERDASWFARGSAAKAEAWNRRFAGKPALNHIGDQGYRIGFMYGIGGLKAHRVIWKMFYGADPEFIDHINGDRADNRIVNLRSVSSAENARNLGLSTNNTSGANGVYWYPRYSKWMASIRINGRRKNLGYFQEKADAIAARRAADERAGYTIRESSS